MLIGYYGGGNYGDELLLETLLNLFKKQALTNMTVAHQQPTEYGRFHHDFGYGIINMSSKPELLRAAGKGRNIIIGGGGLWGVDVNVNILLLSLLLFVYGRLFRKKIFLLGVGYYKSTSKLGHVSAWLAGKAATFVLARDQETFENFSKVTKHCELGRDIAWSLEDLDLVGYQDDLAKLERMLRVNGKMYFITLRRFTARIKNNYQEAVAAWINDNPDKNIIVSLMEPASVDPEDFALLQGWANKYKNVQIADFSYNPLALYLFFKKYNQQLNLIAPQFHLILTAHLNNVRYLPIAYDNKVTELLKTISSRSRPIPINEMGKKMINEILD